MFFSTRVPSIVPAQVHGDMCNWGLIREVFWFNPFAIPGCHSRVSRGSARPSAFPFLQRRSQWRNTSRWLVNVGDSTRFQNNAVYCIVRSRIVPGARVTHTSRFHMQPVFMGTARDKWVYRPIFRFKSMNVCNAQSRRFENGTYEEIITCNRPCLSLLCSALPCCQSLWRAKIPFNRLNASSQYYCKHVAAIIWSRRNFASSK